jgi:hypothetical protein
MVDPPVDCQIIGIDAGGKALMALNKTFEAIIAAYSGKGGYAGDDFKMVLSRDALHIVQSCIASALGRILIHQAQMLEAENAIEYPKLP